MRRSGQDGRSVRWWAAAMMLAVASAAAAGGDDEAPTREKGFPNSYYYEGAARTQMRQMEGKRAPEIDGMTWKGEERSLRELRGKVVVLDFWAVWCPPCHQALTVDAELEKKYRGQDVAFIGIHDGSRAGRKEWEAAQRTAADRGVKFPLALDAEGEEKSVAKRYFLESFPSYVVIDREGVVRAAGIMPGYVGKVVDGLLAEGGGPVPLAEFPAEVYTGGDGAQGMLRELEGKAAGKLGAAEWIGTPCKVDDGAGVTVLCFIGARSAVTLRELRTVLKDRSELTADGARVVAVTPHNDDWNMVKRLAEQEAWGIAVARDTAERDAEARGVIHRAYNAETPPVIVVVDARGRVRAAGVKAARVKDVVKHVAAHAEPVLMKATKPEAAQGAR